MWKNRYHKIYKTKNPELIITAVSSFPNLVNTVEKCNEYYKTSLLKNNEMFFKIYSFYNLMQNGVNFLPIIFEDVCPKLKNLHQINPIKPGFFWCIARFSPYLIDNKINLSHCDIKNMLIYTFENKNLFSESMIQNVLFEWCIKTYVYENTKNFTESQITRRFNIIENKKMVNSVDIEIVKSLETRDIYEIIFNEFI